MKKVFTFGLRHSYQFSGVSSLDWGFTCLEGPTSSIEFNLIISFFIILWKMFFFNQSGTQMTWFVGIISTGSSIIRRATHCLSLYSMKSRFRFGNFILHNIMKNKTFVRSHDMVVMDRSGLYHSLYLILKAYYTCNGNEVCAGNTSRSLWGHWPMWVRLRVTGVPLLDVFMCVCVCTRVCVCVLKHIHPGHQQTSNSFCVILCKNKMLFSFCIILCKMKLSRCGCVAGLEDNPVKHYNII
jgi:hypothetical protein